MPRAKGGAKTRQRRKEDPQEGQGICGRAQPALPHGRRDRPSCRGLRLSGPQGQEAQRPRALDRPHQRGLS